MALSSPRRDRRGTRAPDTAATPRPLRMRRAALVRTGVWAALAAGPVALLTGWSQPAPAGPAEPAPAARPSSPSVPSGEQGPAGFAELFLGVWLRSGTGQQSLATRTLKTMAPSVQPPVWGKSPVAVDELVAVRTVPAGDSAWTVTVAAAMTNPAGEQSDAAGAGMRYFTVPVTLTDQRSTRAGGWSFTAGSPSEVAGPTVAHLPDSTSTTPVTERPLADSVTGFLTAYLGSAGGAERYLAPGTVLPPLPPATYLSVEAQQVLADRPEREHKPSPDGARIRVRADVVATDAAGRRWPLTYALTLTARAGRWEIAALDSGSTTPKTNS
ncbi:conjugal transfer protein [Streptomyces sp. NPDC006339]|uniref:conjugal transfer protein n=1 Tax=Streptomyces sp. NPDC006339 TaxID=3156755 RepID=UPI0033B66441